MEYYDDFVRRLQGVRDPDPGAHPGRGAPAGAAAEPRELKAAVRFPDATMDAMRMPLRFFATAKYRGATLYNFMEVVDLLVRAEPSRARRSATRSPAPRARSSADVVVNATGPWSEKIARMAGVDVPISPSPGVMLAAARPPLQHGDEPDAPVRRRRHRRSPAGTLGRRHQLVDGRGSRRPGRPGGPRAAGCGRRARSYPRRRPRRVPGRVVGGSPADRSRGGGFRPRAVEDVQDDRSCRRRGRWVRDDHGRQGDDAPRDGGALRGRDLREARRRPTLDVRGPSPRSPTPPSTRRPGGDWHERSRSPNGSSPPTRTFRVYRYKRGEPGWRFDCFDVPVDARTTVLEALRWIQLHAIRTLAIRHSCLHASCGTCGIQVNGREALACVTPADTSESTITVEPLANIPVSPTSSSTCGSSYERFPDEIASVRDERSSSRTGLPAGRDRDVRAVRGLHRMRTLSVRVPGVGDLGRVRGAGRARRRATPARGAARRRPGARAGVGGCAERAGGATRRSSAPTRARPTSVPPSGSWRCAADSRRTRTGQRVRDERSGAGRRATRLSAARSSARASGSPARGGSTPAGGPSAVSPSPSNRVTGLGLVFYLYLHLGVLSMLLCGEPAWNRFIRLATSWRSSRSTCC